MPYYYRRWRRPYYNRWNRRLWRRRTRAPFRRRRRKRHYRVRKKLRKITLKEWQPSHIKKLCVKGLYCLWQANHTQINRNWAQYEASVPREGLPNGGGYSLLRFNLETLFEQHELVKNMWTKSNKYFPLYRYTGCSIKVYRPENVDAVIKFQTCYPMSASQFLYMGSQPSIMMMSKGCKIIRCKANAPHLKPYKKFKLPPPQQMTNKWLFQSQHSKTGLLLIQSSAASLDQYYISSSSESAVVTLKSLNTKIFENLNFKSLPTYGYIPKNNFCLYASNGSDEVQDLIWLGNTIEYNEGTPLKIFKQKNPNYQNLSFKDLVKKYMENRIHWGNPFHHVHLAKSGTIWWGPTNPLQLLAAAQTTPTEITYDTKINKTQLKELTQELYFDVRYNPNIDKGYESQLYLKSNWKDAEDLNPPQDKDYSLDKYVFTDGTTTATEVPTHQTFEKEELPSEEEETQKETLFQQLQYQRNKQRDLQHRIRLLLAKLQTIE